MPSGTARTTNHPSPAGRKSRSAITDVIANSTASLVRAVRDDAVLIAWHLGAAAEMVAAVHRQRMSNGPMFGLGSDFVGVEYGKRAVNVSPKGVGGFIDAVRQGADRPRSGRGTPPVPK